MKDDIITSWVSWCSINDTITTFNSTQHSIADIPSTGIQAMRLWFAKEHTSRFISGDRYIIFKTDNIIGKPSSTVIQSDELTEEHKHYLTKESIDISSDIDQEIFNLLLNSTDPALL